ncbi:hypothetical protein [Streptomyces sp. NBC_01589]|uniref:hypothetical protein n=1 Tax=unclassified Streptomyces TaxID=2593676 RepID=UPI00386532A9
MRPAAAPFDPVRIVEAMLGVVDAGAPEKFDQVVVEDEAGDLIVDRDRPPTVRCERRTTIGVLIRCPRSVARPQRSEWVNPL